MKGKLVIDIMELFILLMVLYVTIRGGLRWTSLVILISSIIGWATIRWLVDNTPGPR